MLRKGVEEMTDKEKEFIKKIYIDKAKIKSNVAIIVIALSLSTYIMVLIYDSFDFGIIFEGASLIFLLIARIRMSQYDEIGAKRYIICSIVAIGWILIYYFIVLFVTIEDIVDVIFFGYYYMFWEISLVMYIGILFGINRDLAKADNPERYKESTDWFYEKYDEKEEKK